MTGLEMAASKNSSASRKDTLFIVCMAYGNIDLAEMYVDRLFGMLERCCPFSFRLICYTDKPRNLHPKIEQRDCSQWFEFDQEEISPYMRKLGLFNPDYMGSDEFIYLDLTLVIKKSLHELFECAFSCPQDLVIAQDWHYNCYNSSVMRIRPLAMRFIYDAFVSKEQPLSIFHGDQDFIHFIVSRRHKQHCVALFHDGMVVSFKRMIKMGRRNPILARNIIDHATIIKFHGAPRMHQAFDPIYHFFNIKLQDLLRGKFRSPISMSDLNYHWRGSSAP